MCREIIYLAHRSWLQTGKPADFFERIWRQSTVSLNAYRPKMDSQGKNWMHSNSKVMDSDNLYIAWKHFNKSMMDL